MTSSFLVQLAYIAAAIAVPSAAISVLAFACASRRATRRFAYSVLLLAGVAAISVPFAIQWWNPYSEGLSTWRDVLGSFLSWAPIFLLPAAFVWECVNGSVSSRWIPALATLGVVLAMPIGYILGAVVS
jgi:hypothetical protein